jgi:hypothetical protein
MDSIKIPSSGFCDVLRSFADGCDRLRQNGFELRIGSPQDLFGLRRRMIRAMSVLTATRGVNDHRASIRVVLAIQTHGFLPIYLS